MKKIFFIAILMAFTFNSFSTPVSEKPAFLFYQSIISSIESVKGRVIFFLNDGYWKTKMTNNSILWNVDPFTKMTVNFDYNNGLLASAEIRFNIPIHLQILGTKCSSIAIKSIKYSNDGSVSENPEITFDNHLCSASTIVNITRALSFSTSPKNLFLGKPFASVETWQKCNENGSSCEATNLRDLIYEVKFYPEINESSALKINLKPNSTILFSNASINNSNLFNNYVLLNPGTNFNFQELDYKLENKELSGYISDFTINVQRGAFASSDCFFDMGISSSISLKNVSFFNNKSNSIIDATSGLVDASLSNGSFININSSPIKNHLLLQDNTHVNILGFKLTINEKNYTTIEIGAGSKFALKVSQGTLAFGAKGFVNIINSEIDADLAAVFQSGQPPSVVGRISKFNVSTTSGEFYPNEISKISIGSGNLHSNELFVNSTTAPYITGTYDNFSIDVSENSVFAIPNNGLKIITEMGGKIYAQDASNPLRFSNGSIYPTGSFDLNLPFKSFINSTFKKFALYDGTLKGKFDFDNSNSIYGTNITTIGTLLLDVQIDEGHKTIPINFNIEKGSLTYNNGRPQQFSGTAAIRINPSVGSSIIIKTPPSGHIQDHDDARVYSISLLLSLKDPFTLGPTPIAFNGTDISFNIATNIVAQVTIPPGCGEYDGDDYSPANCPHGGPDEIKNFQELARDKFLTSTIHIYLNSNTYIFDASININYSNSEGKLIVNLTNLKNRNEIAWSKDGGGIFVTLGDVLAFLFNGICGILPFIDCHVTSVTDAITKAIDSQIANKISGFNKTWQIKVEK